jgi:putative DNA primase/helicase
MTMIDTMISTTMGADSGPDCNHHQPPEKNGVAEAGDPNSFSENQSKKTSAHGPQEPNTDAEIERLARMPPIAYDLVRGFHAEQLGIRVGTLDKEVALRRTREADPAQNGPVDADPWPKPKPVKLGTVLKLLTKRMRSRVAFTEAQALVVALWVIFTYTHDAFTHSPQLLVTSPEANSGKSTLLGLIKWLARKGMLIVNPSTAVLYRAIEAWHPTLICDEADDQFKDNPDLRAVFNSGWTRGTGVLRCHPKTNAVEMFPTFAPKAIGMKGKRIPDTTLSRCITIEMTRKKPGTTVADFNHLDDDRLLLARRLLARWSIDNIETLRTAKPPVMPEGFENRLRANWSPLLAIAQLADTELADADWAERTRKAAKELSQVDQGSIGTTLLADIKTIFEAAGRDRLSGQEIVEKLHAMEDRPWAEWGRAHKPISKHQLASKLKEFAVCPEVMRIDGKTPRGYEMVAFKEAWERYIPPPSLIPLPGVQQCNKRDEIRTSATSQSATPEVTVALRKSEKPNNDGLCCTVALRNTPSQGGRVCNHCGRPDLPGSRLVEASITGVSYFGHEVCILAAAPPLKRNIGGAG